MKIELLAFDSMGVRSMATFVKTKDTSILIDPGVELGQLRYKLEPHPLEYKEKIKRWFLIESRAKEADLLAVTHYHYDHYNPDKPDIFTDKTVFLKDPESKTNSSQKRRASTFIPSIEKNAKSIEFADGKSFKFGGTKIVFSEPVFHGTTPKLGYVLQTMVDDGTKKVVHTSDIEGPNYPRQTDFIKEHNPDVVVMDGPLTYMLGYRYSLDNLNTSLGLIKEVLAMKSVKTVVLDHHFMRDLKWEDRIVSLFRWAKEHDAKVMPASRFMGEPLNLFEARRKELWKEDV